MDSPPTVVIDPPEVSVDDKPSRKQGLLSQAVTILSSSIPTGLHFHSTRGVQLQSEGSGVSTMKQTGGVLDQIMGDDVAIVKKWEAPPEEPVLIEDHSMPEPDEQTEVPVTAVSPPPRRLRATPIQTSGDDYLAFVLTARCILHPLVPSSADIQAEDWSRKVSFGLKESLMERWRGATLRVTPQGLRNIQQRIQWILVQNNQTDPINQRALKAFLLRTRFEAKELLKNGKDSVDAFVDIFREGLIIDCKRKNVHVTEQQVQKYEQDFRSMLMEVTTSHSQMFKSVSEMTVSSQLGVADETAALHEGLQTVFNLTESDYKKIISTERAVQTDEVIRRELKARLLNLDNHPAYNKDTFVQKTAAFLKWRAAEEETIRQLLRLVPKGKGESDDVLPPPLESDTSKPTQRQLAVSVLRCKGLMPKSHGTTNAFVLVEYAGETMQTNTIVHNTSPTFDEVCLFTLKDRPSNFEIKVSVWEAEPETSLLATLNPLREPVSFLGQVQLNLSASDLANGIIEKRLELEKRSKKSNISGSIHLKVALRIESDNQSKSVLPTRTQTVLPQLNVLHLFDVFINHVVDEEVNLYYSNEALRNRTVFKISPVSMRLISEFCLRYGVSKLHSSAMLFSLVVEYYIARKIDIMALSYVFFEMKDCAADVDAHWTKAEVALLDTAIPKLEGFLTGILSRYKDNFPYSTPQGYLSQTLRAFFNLYSNSIFPAYAGQAAEAKDMDERLRHCVRSSCATQYERIQALSLPLVKPKNAQAKLQQETTEITRSIIREIDTDAVYFVNDFVTAVNGIRPQPIDLIYELCKNYSALLTEDVGQKLLEMAEQFFPESLIIYRDLRWYNTQCLAFLNGQAKIMDECFVDAEVLVRGQVLSWLGRATAKSLDWVDILVARDDFVPLSDNNKHSSSIVDLFCIYSETVDFINDLGWGDEDDLREFYVHVAQLVESTCVKYCDTMSEKLARRAEELEAPKLDKESFTHHFFSQSLHEKDRSEFTRSLCVAINDLVFACMELEKIQTRFTMPSKEVSSYFTTVNSMMQSKMGTLLETLISPAKAYFDKAVAELVSDEPSKLTKWFRFGSKKENENSSHPLLEAVMRVVDPLQRSLDQLMVGYAQLVYNDAFVRSLSLLWRMFLETVEDTITEKAFTTKRPFDMLNEAVLVIWEVFRGENNDGMELAALDSQRYKVLVKVITILRTDNPAALVNLHEIYADDNDAQSFIRRVARRSPDKAVREFAKRPRSHNGTLTKTAVHPSSRPSMLNLLSSAHVFSGGSTTSASNQSTLHVRKNSL